MVPLVQQRVSIINHYDYQIEYLLFGWLLNVIWIVLIDISVLNEYGDCVQGVDKVYEGKRYRTQNIIIQPHMKKGWNEIEVDWASLARNIVEHVSDFLTGPHFLFSPSFGSSWKPGRFDCSFSKWVAKSKQIGVHYLDD